ncbi:MAG: hypothetical protein KGJ98_01430 [Chloroflexota bacterium]|nr:hypothetical protein [Chloroflexota bacterium]MDE3100874.1 hypothetical protein [Chloroflexota bacterium]
MPGTLQPTLAKEWNVDKLVALLAAIVLSISVLPQVATADGGSTGGAKFGPLTPEMTLLAAQKLARAKQSYASSSHQPTAGPKRGVRPYEGNFYVGSNAISGLDEYKTMLWSDIHVNVAPVIPVVWTYGLPGWGWGVDHWVTVRQFWYSGDTTTYTDSSGPVQASSSTYGDHVMPLSTFYSDHIATAYNKVVW